MFSKFALIAGMSLLALVGCGGSSGVSVNVFSLSAAVSSRDVKFFSSADLAAPLIRAVGDFGAAAVGSTGLESYKLYISSIQICESITTSVGSTAYNNPTNCSTIYENNADDYDSFNQTNAAAAGAGKYIDILSQTDRASLTRTASVSAGTYNVGIINWYRPLKVKGTVALQGGGSLKTKACTSATGACTSATDMGAGTAEESIIDLNNGGTWFRFLKPFTVADGDSVNVDLAFDLEKKLFPGANVSNGFITGTSCTLPSGPGNCGIFIPILRLSPVPRKSTETTKVEIYEMSPASGDWKLRVDVFYNSADTTQATLAADLYPIPTPTTASSVIDNVYVYSVDETPSATTFKAYDGSTSLTFTRGASGTGNFTCPSNSLPGCSATGATIPVTWASREVKTLQN